MAKRVKKHEEEEHENHERWLVSFADMMTLLMVLFIVLFAMATVDVNKFDALKRSLNGDETAAHSVIEGGGSNSVIEGGEVSKLETSDSDPAVQFNLPTLAPSKTYQGAAGKALLDKQAKEKALADEAATLKGVREEIQASLDAAGLSDKVKFTTNGRGLIVSIVTDQVLFDVGQARVRPEAKPILDAIGKPLKSVGRDIAVEGYTDNSPIATAQFPSNWELSTARATSVLRYLVEKEGVSSSTVVASGYGSEREAVPNDSDAHRSQNRRVEVVVLSNVNN